METITKAIEQPLETSHEASDKGLDDQSFFDATKAEGVKLPTAFIMQRMLRME